MGASSDCSSISSHGDNPAFTFPRSTSRCLTPGRSEKDPPVSNSWPAPAPSRSHGPLVGSDLILSKLFPP